MRVLKLFVTLTMFVFGSITICYAISPKEILETLKSNETKIGNIERKVFIQIKSVGGNIKYEGKVVYENGKVKDFYIEKPIKSKFTNFSMSLTMPAFLQTFEVKDFNENESYALVTGKNKNGESILYVFDKQKKVITSIEISTDTYKSVVNIEYTNISGTFLEKRIISTTWYSGIEGITIIEFQD